MSVFSHHQSGRVATIHHLTSHFVPFYHMNFNIHSCNVFPFLLLSLFIANLCMQSAIRALHVKSSTNVYLGLILNTTEK